uniref:ABC-type transport system, involved in lipoprotein release, permease component n=1 Tax=Candidatus Kentrum sp. MB TaxID=2138164 RepID=A0A450X8K2_9GAMM|nr:MAG: ABC-type transport system, involved in lipoprotein release, permease component [Candidatus Kentron sp. MB]VFK29629.1 MAG: ABC-type transport system, involved in lipoprotein release, permease component [Candidatus Kentron sp. MB]VFK74844.1 MAG: ABC-type transport system, involved in lipoprotein release, permease component [Candidatus Kentron sp. MB]
MLPTNTFSMALRNLARNKRRTILTSILIIFGVVTILFSSAFLDSMVANWRNAIVNADIGHVQIMRSAHRERLASLPLDSTLDNVTNMVDKLSLDNRILAASPRISFTGLAGATDQSAPFLARAVNLDNVVDVLPKIYGTLVEGAPLRARGDALLAAGLAKLLSADLGDVLLLTGYDKYSAINAVEITVVGILRIPEEQANNTMILTDFETGRELVGFDDEATEIVLRTPALGRLSQTLAVLNADYGSADTVLVPWSELAGSFNQAANMFEFVAMIISAIIYVVVLVTLANTILTTVFERIKETGMLMAMGTSPAGVVLLYLGENLLLSFGGVALGVLLHWLITAYTGSVGITVPPPPGAINTIVLYPTFTWPSVLWVALSMILVTLVASLYPTRLAAKLDPVEAINAR